MRGPVAPHRNVTRMSEREHLQRWLSIGARRERLVRVLRALGTCTCIAAASGLAWRALPLTGLPSAVLSALLPLLLLVASAGCRVVLVPAVRGVGRRPGARRSGSVCARRQAPPRPIRVSRCCWNAPTAR